MSTPFERSSILVGMHPAVERESLSVRDDSPMRHVSVIVELTATLGYKAEQCESG